MLHKVEITLPLVLKNKLVDDWEFIFRSKSVCKTREGDEREEKGDERRTEEDERRRKKRKRGGEE